MVAAYCKGPVDLAVSRLIDVTLSFPSFLLALAIIAVLGRGIGNVVLAIALSWWAGFARFVRGIVLAEQQRAYVQGARALGASHLRVLARHLLPNILGPVLVLMSVEVGGIILSVSALSFLGLGVGPPFPEWGAMVAEARGYVGAAPHMIAASGGAIILVVLGCNLLAEGVQDGLEGPQRR
jgi:peptide/nickel transport system permease protein